MACFEVSRNLQTFNMLSRHDSFDASADKNLKLTELPYQILQGLLSCFGSLKRFTVVDTRKEFNNRSFL